jgi:anti-sigma B factor antagonist
MIAIRELVDSGCTIVEPGMRLTLENSSELLNIVQSISTGIAPALIVNLEQTEVIDSSGVGALVNSLKHIQKRNGTFVLAGLRPEILHMFQLMNLHQVFDIFETEDLAQKQLTSR